MEHFFSRIQVKTERKKKGLHQKRNTFFPRIQVETCAQMHTRVKLMGGGGDADVYHTQIIGGIQSNYYGEYIPPSPPGFGTPVYNSNKSTAHKIETVWLNNFSGKNNISHCLF